MKQWSGISEFVAVSEHGSFTEAGRALNISVAQVSRNIAELESRLGLKLLYRSTRKVSLTEEGKIYLVHCRHLVESLEQANQVLSSRKETPRGLLKITAPVYYGETQLAPLISEFLSMHPDVELDLHLTNRKLDLIQGGFDLAIRLGQLESSSLIARKLSSRLQHIVAAPHWIEQHGEPVTITDLRANQCLRGSVDYWRLQDANGNPIQFKPQGRVHCNSGPFLREAALQGLGLVQLPDYYVLNDLKAGRLVSVLSAFQAANEGIWAVYPQNRHLSAKVRHLVDFLQQTLNR